MLAGARVVGLLSSSLASFAQPSSRVSALAHASSTSTVQRVALALGVAGLVGQRAIRVEHRALFVLVARACRPRARARTAPRRSPARRRSTWR